MFDPELWRHTRASAVSLLILVALLLVWRGHKNLGLARTTVMGANNGKSGESERLHDSPP